MDQFQNVFGPVRLIVDKIRELEMLGQAYGFSQYLPQSIIVYRAGETAVLYQVFIPTFTYYFEFLIEKDPKTKAPYISDFRIVYPTPTPTTEPPSTATETPDQSGE
ncbi:hypothetical protein ARV1_gp21 [Acidianus rod-shaped virus 1]|uniref:Uncharacterized protein n=1 Tax=Acidianus rod-shaped virus 1 TaxID=309181 RepID=Q50I50_9VIRU|nr:hypothetical protein ARV1_gp21 [Acidianus rod-shaped virus 1]CAI44176.1 hypothetical protein [Acidianus rod-shaped virus 1]